jgi:hypothetical protein
MFHFSGFAPYALAGRAIAFYAIRFPHSEIPGSKVGSHLPEAYRRHPTAFIASISQGIHHLPLKFLALPNFVI